MQLKPHSVILLKYLFGLTLLLISHNTLAGNLRASVDRNQVSIDQSIQLTLSYDEEVDTRQLNYSALEKDFNVLSVNPSSSSSFQIINGRTSKRINIQWRFVLAPKRTGTLTIPGMSIRGDISQAINIKVTNKPNNNQPVAIALNASLSSNNIYLKQQVILTFDFKFAPNVKPNGFNFDIGNTKVQPTLLGQTNGNIVENGIRYHTAKVTYAIFPEKVATYRIKPQVFVGVQNRRQVIARSKEIVFKVKAAQLQPYPTAYWLPANSVKLRDEWSSNLDDVRIGEPITRTIILEVDGQQSKQLPTFKFDNTDDFRFYVNQPALDQKVEKSGIKASRIETIAIIAEKEGELILPEIVLPWWNNKTAQWEEVTLPEKKLNVKPARQTFEQIPDFSVTAAPTEVLLQKQPSEQVNPLWVYTTIVLAVLCLILLFSLILIYQKLQALQTSDIQNKRIVIESEKQLWRRLQLAASNKDSSQIQTALLQWAKAYWGAKVRNTDDIAKQCQNDNITEQLQRMNRKLYHAATDCSEEVDYSSLLENLGSIRSKKPKSATLDKTLPQLYP